MTAKEEILHTIAELKGIKKNLPPDIRTLKNLAASLLSELIAEKQKLLKTERSFQLKAKYSELLEDSNKRLDEKILELSLLDEMSKIFSSAAFDQWNISGYIFSVLKKKIDFDVYALLIPSENTSNLILASGCRLSEGLKKEICRRLVENYTRQVKRALRLEKIALIEIVQEDKHIKTDEGKVQSDSVKNLFTLPLVVLDRSIGVNGIVFFRDSLISKEDENFLNILTAQVALFVENDRIKQEITQERNKLELMNQELKKRAEQVEAANKELEAFSYSVSHDLRAPLRHIDGFVGLLKQNAVSLLDEKGRRYLAVIGDSANQMARLIDDLLAFSRMARSEIRHTRICFGPLVKEVVDEIKQDIGDRSIEWKIGELPDAEADPSMLRLVLVNLIANAVKYTSKRERALIEIGSREDAKGGLIFFVRDNGVGFNMQYVDKLFGVFQRLHSTEEFEGTGIGLANVRRIISRHGGKTWAESPATGGATFYFSLPK